MVQPDLLGKPLKVLVRVAYLTALACGSIFMILGVVEDKSPEMTESYYKDSRTQARKSTAIDRRNMTCTFGYL